MVGFFEAGWFLVQRCPRHRCTFCWLPRLPEGLEIWLVRICLEVQLVAVRAALRRNLGSLL